MTSTDQASTQVTASGNKITQIGNTSCGSIVFFSKEITFSFLLEWLLNKHFYLFVSKISF